MNAITPIKRSPETTLDILIVDDNEPLATALAGVVERAGFGTRICLNGLEALEAARSATPAAVFVDLHLPDIHGLIVCNNLRQILGPDVPIIVVSGDTSMANLNALPHVGATYFLSKPLNTVKLLDQLRRWLGGSRSSSSDCQIIEEPPDGARFRPSDLP